LCNVGNPNRRTPYTAAMAVTKTSAAVRGAPK